MRGRTLRLSAAILAAFLLAACSGYSCRAPQVYQAARSVPPLSVPADLTDPDDDAQLEIPRAADEAPQREPEDPCLDAPPDFFSDEEALEAG
ncbi:MAG TPA: hypothetical protein VM616_00800 [Gammaproteobacteria bacterium]|nr:hypothetical protein [Gammaproteobacteria bacterium]